MELKKQSLYTINTDWDEIFSITVNENDVTVTMEDQKMNLGDLDDAVEAVTLILKALREIKHGD